MAHKHEAVMSVTRCWHRCISSTHDDPRAHGGTVEIKTCRCGAVRVSEINQQYQNSGNWYMPDTETA